MICERTRLVELGVALNEADGRKRGLLLAELRELLAPGCRRACPMPRV